MANLDSPGALGAAIRERSDGQPGFAGQAGIDPVTARGPRRRSDVLRTALVVMAVMLAFGGFAWYLGRPSDEPATGAISVTATAKGPPPRIGKPAPDFRAIGLDGQPVQLSDFRGRPVWLSFWATWCPPCRAESPDIEAAYQPYQGDGLAVLALDMGESRETVDGYMQRAGLTFPVASDLSTEVAAEYRVSGVPSHFFIDRDGVVREIRAGRLGKSTIDKALASIMARTKAD